MKSEENVLKDPEFFSCDVLVIGGGGAGLRAAIAARSDGDRDVFVVSKSKIGHVCNTYISKAIVAASGQTDSEDNAHVHLTDTLEGGRFMNDPAIVSRMTQRIPAEISFLTGCGVRFAMDGDRPTVLKIPGHRHPRHLFGANWKGSDLIVPLRHHAGQMGIRFFEHVFVTRLFESGGCIFAAAGIAADGRFLMFRAKTVILATGGYAQIFQNTNNAPGITGDGQALAYALGASMKDMEFVQFYPTALGRRGSRLFLNEKLLAQSGVTLENVGGDDLFKRYGHPDPLAVNRDQLAQLVMKEIEATDTGHDHVVMNLEGLADETAAQMTQLLPASWRKGQKRFQVKPTTHFCMGGIVTNDRCETAIKGLLAVGEAAAGCHGANRLGGNALAEIFSMGSLAGETASKLAAQMKQSDSIQHMAEEEKRRLEGLFSEKGDAPRALIHRLKKTMWHKVGIIRRKKDLETALYVIQRPWPGASVLTFSDLIKFLEFENMRLVAEMVCRAALERTESRGSHFRQDFPEEDNDHWRNNIEIRKQPTGMELAVTPVPHRGKEGGISAL